MTLSFMQATQSSAYAFDKSCQGEDLANVKNAAAEAIKVLQYAQDRIRWQAANSPPAPYDGTLLQDMMGSNDAKTWQNAKGTFLSLPCVNADGELFFSSLVQRRYEPNRIV